MSIIQVSNLTFGYDGSYENVFSNAGFTLDTDWRLGLIGRNGRGKTTLLRLLMGELEHSGSIAASVSFEYFPYSPQNTERNTLEILYELYPDAELWRMEKELSILEADIGVLDRPFCTLSPGERTKVLLAAMFLRENSFLLIDEPTNNLDAHARRLTAEYLATKKGYILVSHDRDFLDRCIDHVLSINRSTIEVQKGNFSTWYENRVRQDEYELAQNTRLRKEIGELNESARRASGWADSLEKTKKGERIAGLRPDTGHIGAKSAKMMKRVKSIERRMSNAAEEKALLLKDIEKNDSLSISPIVHHAQRLVIMEDVSIYYGEHPAVEHFSLCVERGERIALCGGNGCGKSSVMEVICSGGEGIRTEGRVSIASGLSISRVRQDASGLSGRLREYAEKQGLDESLFLTILRKLEFPRSAFDRDISDYSAGQKKKVLIAASLCERAHLYVWDEPLNYIDVFSRMQLEEILKGEGMSLLFVEHDAAFRAAVATREVWL